MRGRTGRGSAFATCARCCRTARRQVAGTDGAVPNHQGPATLRAGVPAPLARTTCGWTGRLLVPQGADAGSCCRQAQGQGVQGCGRHVPAGARGPGAAVTTDTTKSWRGAGCDRPHGVLDESWLVTTQPLGSSGGAACAVPSGTRGAVGEPWLRLLQGARRVAGLLGAATARGSTRAAWAGGRTGASSAQSPRPSTASC